MELVRNHQILDTLKAKPRLPSKLGCERNTEVMNASKAIGLGNYKDKSTIYKDRVDHRKSKPKWERVHF